MIVAIFTGLLSVASCARRSEEYFFPKGTLPWDSLQKGKIEKWATQNFDYVKKPIKMHIETLDGPNNMDFDVRQALPGQMAEKLSAYESPIFEYEDEESTVVMELPISVEEGTKMIVILESIMDVPENTEYIEPIYYDDSIEDETDPFENIETSSELKQKNVVFEIVEETGDIVVVTLIEQEEDSRKFDLLSTWIDSAEDDAVRLITSFKYSNFDSKKLNGFFDFRNVLWDVSEMEFKDSNCFEPIECNAKDDSLVECHYLLYQKRNNCSEIYETEIMMANEWHHTALPVNRFRPVVFDASHGREKFVHLSPCRDEISVVVEDLDGMRAALSIPTVLLQNGKETIPFTAPKNLHEAYEHGLILYKLSTNNIPDNFLGSDTFVTIMDHPISAIDSKTSKTPVKWKTKSCEKDKRLSSGKSVFHKVIPFCDEKLVSETIQASLRQQEHVIDIDVLEIELSKSKSDSRGLNVVVTSTSKAITATQKREIEEAVNIGRILALCLGEEESVGSLLDETSVGKRLKKSKEDPLAELKLSRSHVSSGAKAEALSTEPEKDKNSKKSGKNNFIFIIPVIVVIFTIVTYVQRWKADPIHPEPPVIYRITSHWLGILELTVSCYVWTQYGLSKEIVDESKTIKIILLLLLLFGGVGGILRMLNFVKFHKINKPKLNQKTTTKEAILERVSFFMDCIVRIIPFSLILWFMVVKYRPESFEPSPSHILCYLLQALFIFIHIPIFSKPDFEKFRKTPDEESRSSNIRYMVKMVSFLIFASFILLIEIVILFNVAKPTLQLSQQNRCIWIEQISEDVMVSHASPSKCLTASDYVCISLAAIASTLGLALIGFNVLNSCNSVISRATKFSASDSQSNVERQESVSARNNHFGSLDRTKISSRNDGVFEK